MPIYEYSCKCGYHGDHVTKVDEMAKCPKCDKAMKREFHSKFGINMGPAGAHGGWDETLGHYSTNAEWRRKMKAAGVVPAMSKSVWTR